MTDGIERSESGMIVRKRLQASHAQNSTTLMPSMTGPSPKSYWSHIPGSVIQGL